MKKLLNSNKFRIIASVVVSVILWVSMSFAPSNEITVTIPDIPISIDLPEQALSNNLKVFQGGDITATVEITGNRMTVGSVTKSDISVFAQQTNTITSSGTYTLAISARKSSNIKTGFEIKQLVSPSVITIVVDRNSSVDMNIISNIKYQAASGYYSSVSLSDQKVTIEGPESVLGRISKVMVEGEIDGQLTESKTIENLPLILYDKQSKRIDDSSLSFSVSTASATVSVMPEKSLPIRFDFANKPQGMNVRDYITEMEPENILVAAPQRIMNNLRSITATGPDFHTLKNEIVHLELPIEMPTDSRNLSNQTVTNVTLDLSSMSYIDFNAENFEVVGLSEGYKADVTTKSLNVRIYGPESQLSGMTADDVTAVINIDPQMYAVGSMEVPVSISFSDSKNLCWQYGEYTANVTISET